MGNRQKLDGCVLVVDDDPDLVEMIELVLTSAGHGVVTVGNGLEALNRLQSLRPALILLDMKMPIMDGWEFAVRYHQSFDRQCPIIVLTAAQDARTWAEQAQADGYLAKPFDIADLLNLVEKHMRPAHARP